ncbi:B12-binding domain-containing radical SAM protein [Marinoscillum luteum]|uniref:B12-binding domain-containing radical SAM protein n=1 Tax=Marinoscillum luteum TaxID=861051 RepID=A0ABW7N7Y1_9BACT
MNATYNKPVALIQLPFPSQSEPDPLLNNYYATYFNKYKQVFPQYQVEENDLWEAPLWIAHLDGALNRPDTEFLNFSRSLCECEAIVQHIEESVSSDYMIFFSPLAQNFSLCQAISRALIERGYFTIVGGNMSNLADKQDFSFIYSGIARATVYDEITRSHGSYEVSPVKGKNQVPLGYTPNYRHLRKFKNIPLVRLNASHGCLFACSFCGDAWSRQLHLVEPERLNNEINELRTLFPEVKLMYIGDKTFGQSKEAVANLIDLIRPEYQYELIVQTHISVVTDTLIDQMKQLGVKVVEIGFETASSDVLKRLHKAGNEDEYRKVIRKMKDNNIKVILNVLGGLPYETQESTLQTQNFLLSVQEEVWLFNLYNFVPYPKTPLFDTLKPRIFDWNFANWREDKPPVYQPYYVSPEESWDLYLDTVRLATRLIN